VTRPRLPAEDDGSHSEGHQGPGAAGRLSCPGAAAAAHWAQHRDALKFLELLRHWLIEATLQHVIQRELFGPAGPAEEDASEDSFTTDGLPLFEADEIV